MWLKVDKEIKSIIKDPIMIAGWPGMGNVGVNAVNYMRSKMGAEEFAHIDMSDELMPTSVKVKDGLAIHSEMPVTRFYYVSKIPIIFVESHNEIEGGAALSLMRGVLDLAHELGVITIYTLAAIAIPVSYVHDPQIFGVANEVDLRDRLGPMGIALLEDGQISGMNGVLLGFTNGFRIPSACLMATTPQYAVSLPNPKSSRAIIRFFERLLHCNINMTGMNQQVKEMDKTMLEIEKRILDAVSKMSGDEEPASPQEIPIIDKPKKKTPEGAMQKIEQLFQELTQKKSKKKAARLKEELDRWQLYDLYEDRFLDLFKGDDEEG